MSEEEGGQSDAIQDASESARPPDGQGKRALAVLRALGELEFDEPTSEAVKARFPDCVEGVTRLQDLHPPHHKLPREAQRLWRDLQELVRTVDEGSMSLLLRAVDVLQDELVQTYKLREYLDAQADRLEIDKKRKVIVFDGTEYPCTDPLAMDILKVIRDHGTPVSAAEVMRLLGKKMDEKTVRNHIDRLPDVVKELIKAGAGTGRWLELPPRE